MPTYDSSTNATATVNEKQYDQNNAAYVDGFFTYLTSQMLHIHGFKHGMDFYGSFLALKNDFTTDICDDIDYMCESDFFNKNKDILYTIEQSEVDQFLHNNNDTRNYKPKLKLDFSTTEILQLSDISDLSQFNTIFSAVADTRDSNDANGYAAANAFADVIYQTEHKNKVNNDEKKIEDEDDTASRSSCSSRFSDTEDEDDTGSSDGDADAEGAHAHDDADEDAGAHADSDSESAVSVSDTDSNPGSDQLFVKIKKFPVQVISLECCEGTLDSLVENDDEPLSDDQWESIVLQILMALIAYQQCFHLTHNDLHSNNIMYTKTEEQYLYYKVDEKYYKVPTYGRLFKIIDFGRAIYKFRGNLMCSDSYHKAGDAAGLYNIEPYFNNKKPRLEPNYSFDLCRLGCSLFDAIVEDIDEVDSIESPILKIITDWCKDDKGKNIMYKMNGEERYPDFKLYKMIARLVHQHTPLNVLRNKHFSKFVVNKKTIKNLKDKKVEIMDIDDLPCYA